MTQPRISLKGLLIGFVAVGATAGIMGRMFLYAPQALVFVLAILATIIPFVLAIGTVITLGVRSKRRRLVLWGVVLLLLPFLAGGGAWFVDQFAVESPNDLTRMDADLLVDRQLPKQVDEPWVWQELDRRLSGGDLSVEQIERAHRVLIEHMKRVKPGGWDAPLSWSGEFLANARKAQAVSTETVTDLGDAFYGVKPTLEIPGRVRADQDHVPIQIRYGSVWDTDPGLGVALVWQLKSVLLDGKVVPVVRDWTSDEAARMHLTGPLPPGKHQFEVQLEAAFLDRERTTGLPLSELTPAQWPQPLKRWQPSLVAELVVLGVDESAVKLTTQPAMNPATSLRVERALVHRDRDGLRHLSIQFQNLQGVPMSFSFDVDVKVAGAVVRTGTLWYVKHAGGPGTPLITTQSGSSQRAKLPDDFPAGATAEIVLTPNPRAVEHVVDAVEVWGSPITLRGIPLERLDLANEMP